MLCLSAGADYESVNIVLTFEPGEIRQCADVVIRDDDIVEPTEVIELQASLSPPLTGVMIQNGGAVSLAITDEDSKT